LVKLNADNIDDCSKHHLLFEPTLKPGTASMMPVLVDAAKALIPSRTTGTQPWSLAQKTLTGVCAQYRSQVDGHFDEDLAHTLMSDVSESLRLLSTRTNLVALLTKTGDLSHDLGYLRRLHRRSKTLVDMLSKGGWGGDESEHGHALFGELTGESTLRQAP
jgi:hypothetical protein